VSTTFNWSLWTMPVEFLGSLMIYGLLFAFTGVPGLRRVHRREFQGDPAHPCA